MELTPGELKVSGLRCWMACKIPGSPYAHDGRAQKGEAQSAVEPSHDLQDIPLLTSHWGQPFVEDCCRFAHSSGGKQD